MSGLREALEAEIWNSSSDETVKVGAIRSLLAAHPEPDLGERLREQLNKDGANVAARIARALRHVAQEENENMRRAGYGGYADGSWPSQTLVDHADLLDPKGEDDE